MNALLVTAAWLLVGAAAHAQGDLVDESARRALQAGDYKRVIAVYAAPLAAGTSLADMAHYRLAIALSKTGEPLRAWGHLQQALRITPEGSFASTPARLADLRASIQAACEQHGKPGCEAEPAPGRADSRTHGEGAAQTAAPAQPAAAETPAAVAVTPASAPALVAAPIQHAAPAVATSHTPPVASAEREPQGGALRWEFGALIALSAATLLVVLWCAMRIWRRERRIPEGLGSVEALRDNVASFLASLETSERGRESQLHAPLRALLPLLEREAGRTLYRRSGSTRALTITDKRAVEIAKLLTRRPTDVLSATAHDIEAQFRRPTIA